jgi:tetratricopeptide (TPR) repeat protein
MKTLILFFACILLATAATGYGQTFGCAERDYECQLGWAFAALQDDPDDPENLYNIGLVYQRMGDHPRAINSFTMYISKPGLKPEYIADGYNNRGISQRALKRFDLAVADYSKAIGLYPKHARYYVNRGNASRDMGKKQEAVEDYGRAISVDPKFALAYANRGHYFAEIAKTDDALKDLSMAIELDPTYAEAYYTRAMVYRSRKEFGKAIPDLDKYIALNPGNDQYLADGYLNRGIAYVSSGKLEQAEKDMTKAIELSPSYVDAYKARAILYRQMKKENLAAADERKAAQLIAAPK